MAATRNIFDVQRAVRVVLDQNKITDQLLAVGDVDTLAIDDMIRDAIPRAIRAVLLVAPGVMIDDAVNGIDSEVKASLMLTVSQDSDVKLNNKTYKVFAGTKLMVGGNSTVAPGENGYVTVKNATVLAGTIVGNPATSKNEEITSDTMDTTTEGAGVPGTLNTTGGGIAATIEGDLVQGFYARIALPSNFLRLLSLKMSDWDYAIDHATPRGDATYAIQHSDVYSLRGNKHRPIACVTPDGRYLEAFSCGDMSQTVVAFDYVAIPEIDTSNNTINISDKLYPSVIYYCASLVCTSLGDFNKARAMERIAMQYVTINTNTNREIQSE